MRMIEQILVLTLVGSAAFSDLRSGKIPNRLIMAGYLLGLLFHISSGADILSSIGSALWPIVLWYPLFALHVFGAGDIKLFSVISIFFPMKTMFALMFLSLVYGLLLTIAGVLRIPGISIKCEGTEHRLHQIHFAPAIAAATTSFLVMEVIG